MIFNGYGAREDFKKVKSMPESESIYQELFKYIKIYEAKKFIKLF